MKPGDWTPETDLWSQETGRRRLVYEDRTLDAGDWSLKPGDWVLFSCTISPPALASTSSASTSSTSTATYAATFHQLLTDFFYCSFCFRSLLLIWTVSHSFCRLIISLSTVHHWSVKDNHLCVQCYAQSLLGFIIHLFSLKVSLFSIRTLVLCSSQRD